MTWVGLRHHMNNIMFTCFCKVRVKKELLRSEIGDYDDQYLIERYRLDRNLIENVCDLVGAG